MTMKPSKEKPSYDKSLRPVRQPGQLGDWASLLAVALSIGLWMLWPSAPAQMQEYPQLPEPTCAYGVLSPNSSAGNVLARFSDGPAGEDTDNVFARLPVADTPPIPPPSPATAPELPPPAYADSAQGMLLPAELPPAPAFPFKRSIPTQTGLVVQVSESLRNAGFAFDPPTTTSTNAPFFASASLVFNGDGLVESILIDGFAPAEATSDMARWEAALLLSHATPNATGSVKISLH